jgi:hypothetical protein
MPEIRRPTPVLAEARLQPSGRQATFALISGPNMAMSVWLRQRRKKGHFVASFVCLNGTMIGVATKDLATPRRSDGAASLELK